MDGYGMVRNMIATNRSNLSRVGQRRSRKFESFDTSMYEPAFPELPPFQVQSLTNEYRLQFEEQQFNIDQKLRRKDLIAGTIAILFTGTLTFLFFSLIY